MVLKEQKIIFVELLTFTIDTIGSLIACVLRFMIGSSFGFSKFQWRSCVEQLTWILEGSGMIHVEVFFKNSLIL